MAEFKLNINDPKTGKSYSKTVEGTETDVFKGKKLKDKIPGDSLGLKGYELEISGGSDRQGFPMRWDISGTGRKKPLLVEGVGVRNKGSGIKQRKSIRGNAIDLNIKQINLKIIKAGTTSLKELGFLTKTESEEAKKEEALKEAAAKEAPKEEVKEESTPEAKEAPKEEVKEESTPEEKNESKEE